MTRMFGARMPMYLLVFGVLFSTGCATTRTSASWETGIEARASNYLEPEVRGSSSLKVKVDF